MKDLFVEDAIRTYMEINREYILEDVKGGNCVESHLVFEYENKKIHAIVVFWEDSELKFMYDFEILTDFNLYNVNNN